MESRLGGVEGAKDIGGEGKGDAKGCIDGGGDAIVAAVPRRTRTFLGSCQRCDSVNVYYCIIMQCTV